MSNQISWRGDIGTLKTPAKGPTLPPPKPVEVRLEKGGGDYIDELSRLTRQLAVSNGDYRPVLERGAAADLSFLSPFERKLQEAKRLVEEKEFRAALAPLDEALALAPDTSGLATARRAVTSARDEAVHLKGYCYFELGQLEDSLRTIRPLPDNALSGRVGELRRNLRMQIQSRIVAETLELARAGQAQEAVRKLEAAVELDPEVGVYHFMLGGTLMEADRLDEAAAAVARGLQHTTGAERKRLADLGKAIEQRVLEDRMAPARVQYRRRNYPRARSALDRLEPRFHEAGLYKTFHDYLDDLGGGLWGLRRGKPPESTKPRGKFKQVDALHFFLVREEVFQAKLIMALGGWEFALTPLDAALLHAPHFPYAHFLKATCLYRVVVNSFAQGQPRSLEETVWMLMQARDHAGHGKKDKEIEGASELLEAIDQLLELMDGVRKELEAQAEEVERVNGLIQQFYAIRDGAKDGISSPAHYQEVVASLKQLKQDCTAQNRTISRSPAKETVAQLQQAVQANLDQLAELKPHVEEASAFHELMAEFEEIMEAATAGASAPKQRGRAAARPDPAELRRRLRELRERVVEFRRTAGAEARAASQQLADAVERNCSFLEETDRLQPLITEFENIMSSGGSIADDAEARRVTARLEALLQQARQLERGMTSAEGRKQHQDFMAAITRNLEQLREIRRSFEEGAPVRQAADRFAELMRSIEGGIHSSYQFENFQSGIDELFNELPTLMRRVQSPPAQKAVQDLMRAVMNVKAQLEKARR